MNDVALSIYNFLEFPPSAVSLFRFPCVLLGTKATQEASKPSRVLVKVR